VKEHPFPPLVRWALFPFLAAMASVAGTLVATPLSEYPVSRAALLFGSLAAAAAGSSVLSSKPWIFVSLAPALGWLLSFAALRLASDPHRGVWMNATGFLSIADVLLVLIWLPCLLSAAHALALQWAQAPWTRIGAIYVIAALLSLLPLPFLGSPRVFPMFLSTLAQGAAFLAARTVARWTSPRPSTPFPFVVRWALFPAFAGLAGALGAAAPRVVLGETAMEWAIAGGALSAAGALGAVVSARPWLVAAMVPLFAVCGSLMGFVWGMAWRGVPVTAADAFQELRRGDHVTTLFAVAALHVTAAHAVAIRGGALDRWDRGLAIYLTAGLGAALISVCYGLIAVDFVPVLFCCVLAQFTPARAAAHFARRLRPQEAA
jgi:hypothetical protein